MIVQRLFRQALRPFKHCLHLIGYLEGAGGWSFTPLQQAMVEAVLDTLDPHVARTVEEQLRHRFWRDDHNEGRVNPIFFYDPEDVPKITDPIFEDCLFRVRLRVDDIRQVAHVTFYRRRIFSVEFKKPKEFFEGKAIEIEGVELGRTSDTITRTINRAEHGRKADANP
jgi:hypothetical protein